MMNVHYQGIGKIIRSKETLAKLEATGQYVIEPKMDGISVTVATNENGEIDQIISRSGQIKTTKGFNAFLGRKLGLKNSIFAGELITPKAELHVFDVVKLLGNDVASYDNEKRRQMLERMDIWKDRLVLVPRYSDHFVERFEKIIEAGGEGVVVKKVGAGTTYAGGTRNPEWLKYKKMLTVDYVIMGYDISASTKYKGQIKAIKIGIYKNGALKQVGKVGSMKEKDRLFFSKEGSSLIGKVIEVGGYEVFPSGAMRHPYFIRMRPDLTRHDANLEKIRFVNEGVELKDKILESWAIGDQSGITYWHGGDGKEDNDKRNLRYWNSLKKKKKKKLKEGLIDMEHEGMSYWNSPDWKFDTDSKALKYWNKLKKKKKPRLKESQEEEWVFRDTPASQIYDEGRNDPDNFDFEKGLDRLIEQPKEDGADWYILLAGKWWKHFNYAKGLKALRDLESSYLYEVPREWPRGIEEVKQASQRIKYQASKMPKKPFKLKEDLWSLGTDRAPTHSGLSYWSDSDGKFVDRVQELVKIKKRNKNARTRKPKRRTTGT